jgi:signal transduction histidine kinase
MKISLRTALNFVLEHAFIFFFLGLILLHMIILGSHLEIYNNQKFEERQNLYRDVLTFMITDPSTLSLEKLNEMVANINASQLTAGDSHILLSLSEKPLFNTTWASVKREKFPFENRLQNSVSFQVHQNLWLNCKIIPIYTLYETLIYLVFLDFLILGLYLFYVFSLHRFEAPLQSLKYSAEKLGIDLNATPEKTFGPTIVREAANAMKQLQIRLRSLIATRTQMLAAISHDLRTYITRLKLRIHLLPYSERLEKVYEDLNDMEAMIEDVLNFSGEDILKEKKANFDIIVLLFSTCEDLMDEGLPIHISSNSYHVVFFGCRVAFKRMFINLLQNALKYAREVWVKVHCDDNTLQITFEDNGPGIPDADLQKVFKPFYRAPETRERHVGFGLGLTIAHEVVKFHNGKITITNREKGGLCVTIILPRQAAEQTRSHSPESLEEL